MGIYIFRWEVLKKYLIADNDDPKSSNDFGKNVIPRMLEDGYKLYAYSFRGYWKDVGTIDSLWESNMDILGREPKLNLDDPENRIYARNYAHPSSFIAKGAEVVNSYVAEGSAVYGKVVNSIISTGCTIEKDAEIHDSFVMPGASIGRRSIVRYAIIGEDATVHDNARIGDSPEFYDKHKWGIAVVGKDKVVEQNKILLPKEIY